MIKNGHSMEPCQPTAQMVGSWSMRSAKPAAVTSFRASPVTPNNKEQNRVRVLEAQGDLTFLFTCKRWILLSLDTLQGTNISPKNGILKMMFLFPRWDMLVPWRVGLSNMFDLRGRPREPPTSVTRMSLAMWACDLAWQKWVRSEGSCQYLNNWWWIQISGE